MKKTALLSSIVTIALCLCLIAGSTFALFTSETKVGAEISSGQVDVTAVLDNVMLFSAVPTVEGEEYDDYDEYGKTYKYAFRGPAAINGFNTGIKFSNGGTAVVEENLITFENITPGDKVTFQLIAANEGTSAAKYRYKIECTKGFDLMRGFVVTIEDKEVEETKYASMASYVSQWMDFDAANGEVVDVAIELPVSANNDFENLSTSIKIVVEAVQANANLGDPETGAIAPAVVKYITKVQNAAELKAKLASDEYLHIFLDSNINETVEITSDLKDKTIDANGKALNLVFAEDLVLDNVVLKNVTNAASLKVKDGVSGSLSVLDSTFIGATGVILGNDNGVDGANKELDVTIDNCDFAIGGGATVKNAVSFGHLSSLSVRNCEFNGAFGDWVVSVESVKGNVVFSDNKVDGAMGGILFASKVNGEKFPTQGSLSGNLTIANNKFTKCEMNGTNYMFVEHVENVLTFSNNLLDDVVITASDMVGINK